MINNSKKTYSSNDINEMLKKMQAMQKRIKELENEANERMNIVIKDNGIFKKAECPICGTGVTKHHQGRFWEWQYSCADPRAWNGDIQ